jgi:7-cyano-7-deazaguanine synthase
MAKAEGYEVHALSFDYGQRHRIELECARMQAQLQHAAEHVVLRIDLRAFGGSALTDEIEVPKNQHAEDAIPITYVPARNTIFLSFALGWAEVLGAHDIFIGVNAVDYSGYPDCRPEFIAAFERAANLGTRMGVEGSRIRIHTPLVDLTKSEIIQQGLALGVDYGLTTSCYDPDSAGKPCGECDSCHLRARGFFALGLPDPADGAWRPVNSP